MNPRRPDPQFGTLIVDPLTAIAFPAAGATAIGGTLPAVMAGAAPGVPPRGVVRTTWLGGSAVPFFSFAYIAFIAGPK